MRRYRLVPLLALVIALGACSSNTSAEPRTVTKVVTKTGTPPSTTASAGSAGITVVNPSGTTGTGSSGSGAGASGASGATTTPTPTNTTGKSDTTGTTGKTSTKSKPSHTTKKAPTTKSSKKKIVKVDPLHVSCSLLLDKNDIKDALGAKVSSSSFRIIDKPNPDVKMTGKIKCYFGAKSKSKKRPVTVALAQYKSRSAAQSQMEVTTNSEVSLGAKSSTVKVSGITAHVLLRSGGLLVMRYDDWTLSIALENKLIKESKMPKGLQTLARMVLARVLKHG